MTGRVGDNWMGAYRNFKAVLVHDCIDSALFDTPCGCTFVAVVSFLMNAGREISATTSDWDGRLSTKNDLISCFARS